MSLCNGSNLKHQFISSSGSMSSRSTLPTKHMACAASTCNESAQQLRLLDSFSHRLLKSEIHTSSAHLRLKNHILTSRNSILNQHRIAPRQQQRPKISTESKLSSTSPTQLTTSFGALLFDLVRPGGFSVIRLLRTVHLHLRRTPSSAGAESTCKGAIIPDHPLPLTSPLSPPSPSLIHPPSPLFLHHLNYHLDD